MIMTLKERLLSHVTKNETSGCWEWRGVYPENTKEEK